MNPVLSESNPQLAKTIGELTSAFEKSYDFSSEAAKATFVEGVSELAKVVALSNKFASIRVSVGDKGISTIVIES